MKFVKTSKPYFETLETGKIGHTVPKGIDYDIFICYASYVLFVISIGYLLRSLCLSSFLSSSRVSSYLFLGAISIFVIIMKKGIFRKRHSPICSFVIFCMPIFAPTTTHPKSGVSPVNPLIVVFRYFSCPHRSTREIIL